MRPFAILTMFLAWLIYGAMPALGACPMCDHAMASSPVHTAGSSSAMADMPMMVATPMAEAPRKSDDPCTGGMAHMAFCAFCLVIPPQLAIDSTSAVAAAYPEPGLVRPLQDARPAPVSPPPRLA